MVAFRLVVILRRTIRSSWVAEGRLLVREAVAVMRLPVLNVE